MPDDQADVPEVTQDEQPFSVVFVCTANQARSPMAMYIARQAVERLGLPWSLTSAGTRAVGGQDLADNSRRALAEVGIEPQGFTSTPLGPELVAAADLVLAADTQNRHDAAALDPGALGKSFTLKQLARYAALIELESDDPATLGFDLVAGARLARTRFQPVPPELDDIVDPIGKRVRAFRSCRTSISEAIDAILRPVRESPAFAKDRIDRTDGPTPKGR